jgi:nicotinamide-nucleotide amidase
MIDDPDLLARAQALVAAYAAAGRRIATAESCTGGLVAGLLTAVPGSSAVVERGFVTYSNEAKAEAIGVDAGLIAAHGAVSEPVARAMAAGALRASRADVAMAITGIAGPGGGSAEKPVGLVHLGLAARDGRGGHRARHLERRYGDLGRAGIRRAAVVDALALLEAALAP